MEMNGGCLCGAVRFVAEGVSEDIHTCHCSMCRRWSGGPAFAIRTGVVDFEGAENLALVASSDWAERGFCSQCGSSLFFRLKEGDGYFMYMGAFDDQSRFRLAGEIYIDSKPHGYAFAGEHPRLTEKEFLAAIGAG